VWSKVQAADCGTEMGFVVVLDVFVYWEKVSTIVLSPIFRMDG
jgi:hypothetical protein